MTELTLELIGKGKTQKFSKAELRMGRDPNCDFVLQSEEFPMVGRQHAVLRFHDDAWWVEDLQSTNGTFVNQKKTQRQQLSPGDTLRLGSDGPEIRVQFVNQSSIAVTRPAALAAAAAVTQPSAARRPSELPPTAPAAFGAASPAIVPAEPGPTRVGEPPPTRPVAIGAAPAVAHMQAGPAQPREPAPTRRAPELQQPISGSSMQVSGPEQPEEISEEEDPMNEERLKLLRNLVMLMVALVLVLGGIVISQMQQISDIRQNVRDMRAEARTAVGKFQPELDERMSKMEATMNGMDEKIQKAEDRFVARMEKELPVIMDREVEKQTKKIIKEVETGTLPH